MLTFRVTDRSGPLAVARAIHAHQEVILISREGIVMRTAAEAISRQGRGTQGVAVMNIEEGDALASIAQIDLDEDGHPPAEPTEDPDGPDEPAEREPTGAAEASSEPEAAPDEEPPTRRAGEIGDVPAEEMRAAIETVMAGSEWISHEDALAAIARELRFARLWQSVRTPLERAIHQAILDGVIEENDSQELRRPPA